MPTIAKPFATQVPDFAVRAIMMLSSNVNELSELKYKEKFLRLSNKRVTIAIESEDRMSKYDQPSEPPSNLTFERADSIVEGLTNEEVLIALEHRGFIKELNGIMGTLRSLLRQDIYETLSLEEE